MRDRPELDAIAKYGQEATQPNGHIPDPPEQEPDEPPCDWRARDLTAVLDGSWKPPEPTIGYRTDGRGLLYAGKCHMIIGETESGKSWLALSITMDELHEGHHVLYIDFEGDEGGVVGRLLTLGASRHVIAERFHYIRPESPLGVRGPNVEALRDLVLEYRPTLALLDGVTEAMTMHGLSPLDNEDAARFGLLLPRRLATAGCAVANLDHVTKDKEGRGRYAIGAVHKLNALDGGAYVLENRQPFGIGITGRSTIRISKDRPGALRRNAVPGTMPWYGDLVLKSNGDEYADLMVYPPSERDETERPVVLMAEIAKLLEDHPGGLSQQRIRAGVSGKTERKIDALNLLILDGHVSDKTPHKLLKPFPGGSK